MAHRVGRGIALLFHDRGTRRGLVVSITPRPHFTPGKDPVPIVQEAAWAPGPVWTSGKSCPYRDSMPDRPARSQSLYRLSYRAHSGRRVIPCEWTDKRVDRDDEAQVALESLETRLRQHFFERPLCLPPLKIETETHTPR